MTRIKYSRLWFIFFAVAILSALLIRAHSGYSESKISPLDAAQRGLGRLEKLIAANKADADWAANLTSVQISLRNIKGIAEYVVHLTRSSGNPVSVDFYFSMDGTDTGSSGPLDEHPQEANY